VDCIVRVVFHRDCLALGENNYVSSERKPKLRLSQVIFFLSYRSQSPITSIHSSTSKMGRPKKRARLLEDASDASGDDAAPTFTINDEYAKRFQHNKAREERQRLEEKYGKDAENLEETDASTSEEEDDEAALATLELDAQISETLNALRSKDPRIYNKETIFFRDDDTSVAAVASRKTKEKPIRLQDYHRANLLAGGANGDEEEDDDDAPMTYADEQAAAKRDFLAQTKESDDEDNDSDGGDLLVAKPGQAVQAQPPLRKQQQHAEPDIAAADANPEDFLDKFMASRAWEPKGTTNYQAFESEDESDVERAEQWEAAYNMRFEDPAKANEKLLSHSRDAAAKYSVRREEVTGRKKTREAEKAKKEAIKAERDSDKARLRRLKIDEAQEKLQKFREAAGLALGEEASVEEWAKFLEAGFEDDNWDAEMAKRFGEDYYANGEHAGDDEDGDEDVAMTGATAVPAKKEKKAKTSKPTWDDDIDIGDLVPDFIIEEEEGGRHITLSDDEAEVQPAEESSEDDSDNPRATTEATPAPRTKTSKKDRERARLDARRTARLDRAAIESVVDTHLSRTLPSTATAARFRYRDTSPTTYGLTSLDILLADDADLNAYVGLKKMATFREPEKKRKDKKRLGKKARLREWRRDAFGAGREDGPSVDRWDELFKSGQKAGEEENANTSAIGGGDVSKGTEGEGDVVEGKRKNKRSRKRKAGAVEGVEA